MNILSPPTAAEITFNFEEFVKSELNVNLEKSTQVEICRSFEWLTEGQYYLKNLCRMGTRCAFRHPSKTKLVVCKHWLRGLCKKGDMCEFLHEYNLKKMPECWFYTKLGECTNPECLYLHIDPDSKISDCAWYARGFCKHGALCKHKHSRQAFCQNYLTGFCPKGVNCSFAHPSFDVPLNNAVIDTSLEQQQQQPYEKRTQGQFQQGGGYQGGGPRQSQDEITCFKCGDKGHFANHCPNGYQHNDSSKKPRHE